jgi:hypothetical protein
MGAAMLNLGTLIALSSRGPADLVPAYEWFTLAAVHTAQRDAAFKNRNLIVPLMSRAQIAQALALARSWSPH